METLFTKELTDKLPTLEHYKQLCQNSRFVNNVDIDIDKFKTIHHIQNHIFNMKTGY